MILLDIIKLKLKMRSTARAAVLGGVGMTYAGVIAYSVGYPRLCLAMAGIGLIVSSVATFRCWWMLHRRAGL